MKRQVDTMHPPFPEQLGSIPSDKVVVLSDADFISFSTHWSYGPITTYAVVFSEAEPVDLSARSRQRFSSTPAV